MPNPVLFPFYGLPLPALAPGAHCYVSPRTMGRIRVVSTRPDKPQGWSSLCIEGVVWEVNLECEIVDPGLCACVSTGSCLAVDTGGGTQRPYDHAMADTLRTTIERGVAKWSHSHALELQIGLSRDLQRRAAEIETRITAIQAHLDDFRAKAKPVHDSVQGKTPVVLPSFSSEE